MAAAYFIRAAFYGIKRPAGFLQHDRYDDRRAFRRHSGTFRGIAKQSDSQLCHDALLRFFKRGTGARSASVRSKEASGSK